MSGTGNGDAAAREDAGMGDTTGYKGRERNPHSEAAGKRAGAVVTERGGGGALLFANDKAKVEKLWSVGGMVSH